MLLLAGLASATGSAEGVSGSTAILERYYDLGCYACHQITKCSIARALKGEIFAKIIDVVDIVAIDDCLVLTYQSPVLRDLALHASE